MPEILLDQQGAVASVTLNRPDQLNAMNPALLDQLIETLENLDDEESVSVIVLRGAGRAFCVGGDLAADHGRGRPSRHEGRLRHYVRASEILREGHAVSIAVVDSPAAGAGFSLAAACDLRFISESAVFRSAFLTAGMSGDFGLNWSLTRLLGAARANEIMLLNEKISAEQAVTLGLASRTYPDSKIDGAVRTAARSLAAGPPLAIAGIKANLRDATVLSFTEALHRECARHVATGSSKDAAEAGRAFLEKRQPEFKGR
jgi:2-(1,2-epoxy-1,2-dihydrophenyl)acetyl-CoA isomerase